MRMVSGGGIRRPSQQCPPITTPEQFLKPTTESSGTDPSVLSDRKRRLKTTVSLTSHPAMVRIGHAIFILLRMGGGRPFDLRPDDARVVSRTRERRTASRTENHCGRGETSDDQDPSTALQPLYPLVPALQAQAAAQSAGLAGTERPTSPDSSHARALHPGRFSNRHKPSQRSRL